MASARGREPDASYLRLRDSFAAGDIDGARRALFRLLPEAREELEARIGAQAVQRMLHVARGVRAPNLGRVVVIHGIMGGKLATIDARGDQDLVWLKYFKLIQGRIERFALDANAAPADPRYRVEPRGLLDEYMPLVFDLSQRWQVLPVAFDWRLDIDLSAQRLDAEIRRWANGEPVHIVAHSMGGLVSRRFIRNFAETWAAMRDPAGLARGGRLVMLGTPNRGSFAIPFVLTGKEQVVRMLAAFDLKHDMAQLLDIINTFPGSYQMLPSPLVPVNDDRLRLFESGTWGSFPVPQAYLDRGRRFQQEMHAVQDADRLVYVAGYDQPTPFRVRVDQPGQFVYQETLDGDGRVPHELGLLPDVPNFYVAEKHGDLPANDHVMAALQDLLATGTTKQLPDVRPSSRALHVDARWKTAEEIAPMEAAIPTRRPSRQAAMDVSAQSAAEIEAAMVAVFAGTGAGTRGLAAAPASRAAPPPPPKPLAATIVIEVMWADITKVDGEVVAAGHYEGVEPQAGELALDKAISGIGEKEPFTPSDLLITSQTRLGILRGAVGDINFYPWREARKTVAIAGMGRPGTFGMQSLRRTTRSLAQSVAPLKSVKTVSTLLIGSGNGNLDVEMAVACMLEGLDDAMQGGLANSSVRRIRIVEWELRKAQRVLEALMAQRAKAPAGIRLVEDLQQGPGGAIGEEIAMSAILLATAWREMGSGAEGAAKKAAKQVLQGVTATPALRESCEKVLQSLSGTPRGDVLGQAGRLDLGRRPSIGSSSGLPPTRTSFVRDQAGVRAAAISDTAVVTERVMPVDWTLVGEIVQSMTNPEDAKQASELGRLMQTLFVPGDFHDRLGMGDRLIVEVDRDTARIQWEMMESFHKGTEAGRPLGLAVATSRQLRTSYSPTPPLPYIPSAQLRALVIGDPGDPDKGLSLEGARMEALEVARMLRARGVQVDERIGARNVKRVGDLRGIEPATILDVLRLLDNNDYDILHYAGHGDFDPDQPDRRAGWIFGDRYFTARELASISRIPALVVANACLSALTSNVRATSDDAASRSLRGADDALLPGLVDEFFRRGVRNYVGTAWPVSDSGAVLFSETLYAALLPGPGGAQPSTLGAALLEARTSLKKQEAAFGALWAAYQHYGDPAFTLRDAQAPAAAAKAAPRARAKRRK
jgi:hypothetical protein